MSGIAEARERYGDAVIDYYDRAEGRPDAMNAAFNMLVAAIRAELPCSNFGHEGSDCMGMPTLDPKLGGAGMCPPCEARDALNETLER